MNWFRLSYRRTIAPVSVQQPQFLHSKHLAQASSSAGLAQLAPNLLSALAGLIERVDLMRRGRRSEHRELFFFHPMQNGDRCGCLQDFLKKLPVFFVL